MLAKKLNKNNFIYVLRRNFDEKLLAVIATALFAVVALAGCGSSTDTASSEKLC